MNLLLLVRPKHTFAPVWCSFLVFCGPNESLLRVALQHLVLSLVQQLMSSRTVCHWPLTGLGPAAAGGHLPLLQLMGSAAFKELALIWTEVSIDFSWLIGSYHKLSQPDITTGGSNPIKGREAFQATWSKGWRFWRMENLFVYYITPHLDAWCLQGESEMWRQEHQMRRRVQTSSAAQPQRENIPAQFDSGLLLHF